MHSFKDSENREWEIRLNGYQLKTLKERLNFDARDANSILEAANDPGLLCDVLYVLCEEQCKAKSVSDRQFGEAMAGDAIESAAEAYLQETVDFFPPRQRQTLKVMLAKAKEAQEKAASLAQEKLSGEAMDNMIQKAMDDASQRADQILAGTPTGSSFGRPPAAPDLTRSPSLSASSFGLTGGMNMEGGKGLPKSAP